MTDSRSVSTPPLIKPDVRICRIRLSEKDLTVAGPRNSRSFASAPEGFHIA